MMARVLVLLLACVLTSGQKAHPPQIHSGFPKVTYFYDKTDAVTLECKATGIPDARYEWRKDDKIIRDGEHDFRIDGGKLTLTQPLEGIDDGYYQCFAENRYGKAMSSKAQMIKADLGSFAKLPIANQSFDVGQHAMLACRSKPYSEPAGTVAWYLGQRQTVETNERVVVDQAGDLHFINVLASDEVSTNPWGTESFYNCSLYNALTQKGVYGSSTRLTVNPGSATPRNPTVNFRTPDREAIAYVGQPFTLQCIPDGYPLPTVEWSRNGGSLPEGRHVIDNMAYKLTINNVTENDEGNYKCEAVSGGQRNAVTIFVDVKSVPIWVIKLRSMTLTEGETAKFQCVARSAHGEIDTVITKWFKNGNPLSPGVTGKILVSGAHLEVQDISKPEDLMNIQCEVSNTVGSEMADAFLNVLACPNGTFGAGCNGTCRCLRADGCSKMDGSCTGGCAPGYKGFACQIACPNGSFGAGCRGTCHCLRADGCSKMDGSCTGVCAPGYQGLACQTECIAGYFGYDCNSRCRCFDHIEVCQKPTGRCESGCAAGYTGIDCQQALPIVQRDPPIDIGMPVSVAILATLLVVSLVVAAVLFHILRKARKEIWKYRHERYAPATFGNQSQRGPAVNEELNGATRQ